MATSTKSGSRFGNSDRLLELDGEIRAFWKTPDRAACTRTCRIQPEKDFEVAKDQARTWPAGLTRIFPPFTTLEQRKDRPRR